eukprot:1153419-Pelagomonas_calceolata.AAC.5
MERACSSWGQSMPSIRPFLITGNLSSSTLPQRLLVLASLLARAPALMHAGEPCMDSLFCLLSSLCPLVRGACSTEIQRILPVHLSLTWMLVLDGSQRKKGHQTMERLLYALPFFSFDPPACPCHDLQGSARKPALLLVMDGLL